jgi:hypothetical protein
MTNTTNNDNTAVGYNALRVCTGDDNTAMGMGTMGGLTTGRWNTAVGAGAIWGACTGTHNTTMGWEAMGGVTSGTANVGIGSRSCRAVGTFEFNTCVGMDAFYGGTGDNNTAIGGAALAAAGEKNNNTAVGRSAGLAVTTGYQNNLFGQGAGDNITTGYQCIMIGNDVELNGDANHGYYQMVIGIPGTEGKGNQTGLIHMGTSSGGIFNGPNSASWATSSDERIKKNIVDSTIGLAEINQIQVRNFEYRLPEEVDAELSPKDTIDKEGIQVGVVAQEIIEILPKIVNQESSGVYSVDSDNLTWHLIKAVQELSAELTAAKVRITTLEG